MYRQNSQDMALAPFDRMVPVRRSPFSFFTNDPSWDVGGWDDFGTGLRAMDRQMREMEERMNKIFTEFHRLAPMHSKDQLKPVECWREEDPIVADKDGKKKLKLNFDVRQFKSEEIHVKTKDNCLMVHAKHEESSDNHKVYSEYRRAFSLPQGISVENLTSTLTPEGILMVEAPLAALEAPKTPISIPIEHE